MKFSFPFVRKIRQSRHMVSDSRIQLQFDVEKPVDLVDLTLAFAAFGRQYRNFMRDFVQEKKIQIPDEDSIRLFVTKIESNCIIAELGWVDAGLLTNMITTMDGFNTMSEFLSHVGKYIDYFRGVLRSEVVQQKPTKKDCEDFRDLLTPVVENGTGSLKLKEVKYDKNGGVRLLKELEYMSDEAMKAVRGCDSHLKALERTGTADHVKALMYLERIEKKLKEPDSKTSHDYGVIESVSPKPLPVFWLSEMDQQKVKRHIGNPFQCSFIVDVNVATKRGLPKAYRVVRLHSIDVDEENVSQGTLREK